MYTYSLLEKILFLPAALNTNRLQKSLCNKTILITGASSGIGKSIAYRLSETGAHLILVARREHLLQAIRKDLEKSNVEVSIVQADLRKPDELQRLLTFIHQLPNGLDIVVSNAGLSIRRPIRQSLDRVHDFTRTMAINYEAPVQLLLSVIPLLAKKQGHIVNISTINALLLPVPYWTAYQASKTAFDVWLRSAEAELRMMGITVTSVYLPLVRTPMILPTAAYRKMPAMDPDHTAVIVCRSMYTKKRVYRPWWLIYGQVASVLFRRIGETIMAGAVKRKEDK
ncbi:SDR family NAD(P)-dependent oxidoreductase [Planococcus lenghuensis]|uniref:Epimerase n=1 Tax=Planococcus lenghuensis TaxID=2213202 RepID=A0A1Q2KUE6_9BACL|nr:SDR family NAD(P)-dependent oxidoreductase [Planococcus lenghuensis]AQQ51811.1 epimerase [Planococcus lenghuensis]